eukprot:COSAG01_NODE_1391_length_10493_cov_8.057245_7_plen_204_part_00
MELNLKPVYNNNSIIANANHPAIRLFKVPIATSLQPLPVGTPLLMPASTSGTPPVAWVPASPLTVPQWSAICYLTALELAHRASCGVGGPAACHYGLVQSCLGSTDVQSWMSSAAREDARTGCWAEGAAQPPPAVLPPSESHAPSGNITPVRAARAPRPPAHARIDETMLATDWYSRTCVPTVSFVLIMIHCRSVWLAGLSVV